jgi:uridine phosphorylase
LKDSGIRVKCLKITRNERFGGEQVENGTLKDPANRDTAIVYPLRRKKDPFVGPDALMAMTPADVHALKKILKLREIPMIDVGLCRFYQAEKESPGPALTLVGPILGAPQAVIAMEKLIVLGAKRIWILGWCGSLQPGLSIGDLVVPVRAVSEEGTSRHYPVGEREIACSPELNRMLEASLLSLGRPFRRGAVWTTDAPYRETVEKVMAYQAQGILAVEMEMSALMTLALYRSVSVAGLLVVSDELFDLKWKPGFSHPSLKKASQTSCEILAQLARQSPGQDPPSTGTASWVWKSEERT